MNHDEVDGEPEQLLTGGNVTAVSRRGDAVLRASGPWTPSVHAVLVHAREVGLTWVPQPLGIASDGREVLEFIDGTVPAYPMPEWLWSESVLVAAAKALRAWHDATAGYLPPDAVWRLPPHAPVEVVCHNDFAQYNLVFDVEHGEPRFVGAIDFDTMSPGPRIWDLAYLAYRLVPYLGDADRGQPGSSERSARLRLLLHAYGTEHTQAEMLECMADRLVELAEFTEENAAASGRTDLLDHAALYREDAARIRADASRD